MQKKATLWLTLILSVLLPLVAACGSNTTTSHSTHPTVTPKENLYVLDGYTPLGNTAIGQHILAFHSRSATSSTYLTLPDGLTSQDHQRLYTATAQHGQTTISMVNTQTGAAIHTFVIPGSYATTAQDFSNSVLSFDGQWLVLRQLGQNANATTLALVDTKAGRLMKTISLHGTYDLDAVSLDGNSIYLLEKLNDQSGHYYVRLYQVDKNQLYPYPLVDKTIPNDIMTGSALARQMSSDGSTAYTLYIDTVHNIAFVHILPLGTNYYGARCIDLPVGKTADLLHYYTLTLSSDQTTLYAANGALGVVNAISLNGPNVFDDKISNSTHFTPDSVSMTSSDKTRMLHNGAALSSDQKTLYFVGMHGIWAVNTSDLHKRGSYLTQQALTGVAVSADNRTLYAVDPANGITTLDIPTGQAQQVISSPAHTLWGIEWITN